jgi:thioesterase domain-containing protein
MDEKLLNELGETLRQEMPISNAMAIETVSWDGARLAMQMPLEPNRNHQYSAFAGSLNALCTVVGWGTVFLLLKSNGLKGNVVIRRGKIRFLRPVRTPEIVATGLKINPEELAYFFELLQSKGKSKIDIHAEIADDQGAYVSFKGSYVVQREQ